MGYTGVPPLCRPECTISSDCRQNQACSNQKCIDPCPGTCGVNAKCQVINHNPICSCPSGYTGNAFINCYQIRKLTVKYLRILLNSQLLNNLENTNSSLIFSIIKFVLI